MSISFHTQDARTNSSNVIDRRSSATPGLEALIDYNRPYGTGSALEQMHEFRLSHLEWIWKSHIKRLADCKLDRLHVDFEECYCESGCCRLVKTVVKHMGGPTVWRQQIPKVIGIFGWLSEDEVEKTIITEQLARLGKKTKITFIETLDHDHARCDEVIESEEFKMLEQWADDEDYDSY